uniref:topoisomerase DNA-binding C4 zinc finger domain-containing protein n=1 Tax=Ningiella ruwaisensis TaxID=2364274 RepID=UPI00109FCD33|nr:topoisomerase DNA-binding C4 zinc finger domain-containing protein [Ningiella ruwaisensis]
MAKINDELFSQDAAKHLAYGSCPECDAALAIKYKGKSSFLACTQYPKCDYTKSLSKNDVEIIKLIADSECPECKSELAVKKGRFGMFIGCTNFPSCHFISNTHSVKKAAEYAPVSCPACKSGKIEKKQNRFGKFFYACDNYPHCKYVVNAMPVAVTCSECGSSIMLSQSANSKQLNCPNTDCGHQQIQE